MSWIAIAKLGRWCSGLVVGLVATSGAIGADARYDIVHSWSLHDGNGTNFMVRGSDGRMYGAQSGGGFQAGQMFRLSPGGKFTLLARFEFQDGNPVAPNGLLEASNGHFYGTSYRGGTYGGGSIFRMNRHGDVTVLYSFIGNQGGSCKHPTKLMEASDGNFYGVTYRGGHAGQGCTYRMTKSGELTVLHEFDDADGIDGASPAAQLVEASDGFLYGTTSEGGRNHAGTVFRMNRQGFLQVIHAFVYTEGAEEIHPTNTSNLVVGPDQQLYFTVAGSSTNGGSIYRLELGRKLTEVYLFDAATGKWPQGNIHMGADGTITGVTVGGTPDERGNAYQWSSQGGFKELHRFAQADEGAPSISGMFASGEQEFYGMTLSGGENDYGVLWRLRLK